MKIYTKGGDAGETGLFGGSRVPKDDLRIRAYGALDELNSVLGMALAEGMAESALGQETQDRLLRMQGELFQLGAELATPRGKKVSINLIDLAEVETLEKEIDEMEKTLAPLKTFILPGGAKASAQLHFARTVSRRAEREMVSLNRAEPLRPVVMQYINRVSDHLFVMARFVNSQLKYPDVPWVAPKAPR